ncbi:uncharacterized protein LOC134820942 [Bolinopsis microptera]|uniref:uncharacterized protein LOC134820942 n=1 Tax=Bolinopsis microptera TaxID=2820187 RepID=UPI0030791322
MLNKPLNVAHAKDRQAQRCIKKGLFDSAVNLERNIIENLEEALKDSTNPLAVQSIVAQKARHSATLARLEKEIGVRDRARRCVLVTDLPPTEMNEIPQFGGKSAPVLSSSYGLPSNASDKDRMILRLQDKVAILTSQLEESKAENTRLSERVKELERNQGNQGNHGNQSNQSCSTTQLLSPHTSSYHHVPPPPTLLADPQDAFSLTPLEQPPVMDYNFKW